MGQGGDDLVGLIAFDPRETEDPRAPLAQRWRRRSDRGTRGNVETLAMRGELLGIERPRVRLDVARRNRASTTASGAPSAAMTLHDARRHPPQVRPGTGIVGQVRRATGTREQAPPNLLLEIVGIEQWVRGGAQQDPPRSPRDQWGEAFERAIWGGSALGFATPLESVGFHGAGRGMDLPASRLEARAGTSVRRRSVSKGSGGIGTT